MTLPVILLILAALAAVYLFMVFPGRASREQTREFVGRNYAHRGLYGNAGELPPENTLAAFDGACKAGYGMELDVQFSADGALVVFHDNDLKRSCGVDKNVWDCPLAELQSYDLFGRDYHIPLFSDVLKTVAGRGPLIVEIKAEGLDTAHYYRVCDATWQHLKDYPGLWCVESFHPAVVRWWRRNHPQIVRGQLLNGARGYRNISAATAFLLASTMSNFLTRPHFIAYEEGAAGTSLRLDRALGALAVLWTVRTPERAQQLSESADMIIFENYKPQPRIISAKYACERNSNATD